MNLLKKWQSKKSLQKQVEYFEILTTSLKSYTTVLSHEVDELTYSLENRTKERDEWRAKYELLLHTPEYKADTEAAFKRGSQHTTNKFRAWFLKTAEELESVTQGSDEE